MISKEQEFAMLERLKLIIGNFQKYNNITELSKDIGISTSTIQRDLNKKKEIVELIGEEGYYVVEAWLLKAKLDGLSKGGKNSQEKYNYDKDEVGHYRGIKR